MPFCSGPANLYSLARSPRSCARWRRASSVHLRPAMLRPTAWRRWAAAAVLPRRFLPTAWDFGGAWGAAADFLPADSALEDGFPPAMTQRPVAARESGVKTHPSILTRYDIRQTNRERSAQQVFSVDIFSGDRRAAPTFQPRRHGDGRLPRRPPGQAVLVAKAAAPGAPGTRGGSAQRTGASEKAG